MWTRMDLKMRAKQAFQRNYWPSVIVAFVLMLIVAANTWSANRTVRGDHYYGTGIFSGATMFFAIFAAFIAIVGIGIIVLDILVGNPLKVGGYRFFILNQTETAKPEELTYVFRSGNYGNVVLIMFLRELYIFFWMLLLIVPGIVKSYEYRMVPYILAENPGMPRAEAFLISKKMMMGQKFDTFVLDLSFIGWGILEAITFGIVGIFYVEPYRQATFAELYASNRELAYQNGYIR